MINAKIKGKSALARSHTPNAIEPSNPRGSFSQDLVEEETSCSPLEFNTFIPWLCKQWCTSTSVIIIQKSQENFVKVRKTKLKKSKPNTAVTIDDSESLFGESSENMVVPIRAYYNTKKQLVEISIVGSKVAVSRKIIQAFSITVPYHAMLSRFTFRRSGLTAILIYEINKLLPISNICEIIFDDSYVREGNYYILLEQNSQLKYLSLNRCNINDEACKKIFEKIHCDAPAGNTLQILELGSNEITDDAAIFIGSILRFNRCLLHLNLSGNKITDNGFIPILDSLMEFPMNTEEKYTMRRKKIRYLQSKEAIYARCLKDLKSDSLDDLDSSLTGRKLLLKHLHKKPKKSQQRSIEENAEIMAKGIIGEFNYPFSHNDVEFKNGSTYSKGNFVLCSINIAYNDLYYLSVRKLWEVLRYQDGTSITRKSGKDTGLIRITLDGNKIPQTCSELHDIEFYLKKTIDLKNKKAKTLAQRKSHPSSRSTLHSEVKADKSRVRKSSFKSSTKVQ